MRIARALVVLTATAGLLAPSGGAPAAAAVRVPDRLPGGLVVAAGTQPLPPGLTAATWLVADLDTGQVLAAHEAHQQRAPASTLKVLTALSLLPVVPPHSLVEPTQEQIDVEGSKVGLLRGVPYPAEELYASLLMVSGNDAANALAGAAGGQAATAERMNATAARLGAVDTHAVNPHGLDAPGQVSSAYDLAVVARSALSEPDIARWVTTRRSTMSAGAGQPRFEIYNHNKLLGAYEGALGVKNGYTSSAGASFVGAAERSGRRLVVTVMKAQPKAWTEAALLLDWGFGALAAGAAPVGALPAPPQPEPAPPVEPSAAAVAPGPVPTASGRGLDLPTLPARQVAGGLLVVAAVLAVRPARRRRTA